LKLFLDSMGGGAWPFLVGGVICLVNSVNERDLSLLTSQVNVLTGEAVESPMSFGLWVLSCGSLSDSPVLLRGTIYV
jgi:hypothetical protein